MRRVRARAAWLISLVLVLGLAAWARVANYPAVLGQGELTPQLDGDSAYHLLRIERTLRTFPQVPHFDAGMNWPAGAFCPWADGFDLSAATFARLLGGGDAPRQLIAIALWPVVLGLLVVWATVRLVRLVRPGASWAGAALGAGLLAALLPVGVWNARFGRIDHHVVEALSLTLLAAWTLRRVPAPGQPPPAPLAFELQGALLSGLSVWCFSGSPLYVALAAAPLAWMAVSHGRMLGSGGPGLAGGGLLALLLTLPAIRDHGRLVSFKYPSALQPLLLVAAGLGVVGCAWAGRAEAGRLRRRLLLAGMALAAGLALLLALAPQALAEVRGGVTGWLLGQDAWLASVGEFQPLVPSPPQDGPPWSHLYQGLGWAGFFAPVALVANGWLLRSSSRGRWLIYFVAAGMVLSLLQSRFSRVAVPLLACVLAIPVAAVLRRLGRRRAWPGAAPVPALALGLALAVDQPTAETLQLLTVTPLEPVLELAAELRDLPPPPGQPPGVLSSWGSGHKLQLVSGLPVVVNGFGSYLDEAGFWAALGSFGGSAEALDRYLEGSRVGVLVAGASTLGNEVTGVEGVPTFLRGGLDPAYMSRHELSPLIIGGSGVPGWGVRHLPHLMPRAASLPVVVGLTFPLPYLWTFERVAGATVRGTAAAGQRVQAELRFREHGRPHTYKAWGETGPDGRWTLVLPFPSSLLRPTLRSEPRWRVAMTGRRAVEFELPERAVRAGEVIDVGQLPSEPVATDQAAPGGRP